jgi:hypothetical protein
VHVVASQRYDYFMQTLPAGTDETAAASGLLRGRVFAMQRTVVETLLAVGAVL